MNWIYESVRKDAVGFSLVELIVAIGIFSILAAGVTYLAIGSYDAFIGKGDAREMHRLAEDAMEVLTIIKENSWSEVATTTTSSVYPYKKANGSWALGLGTQTIGSFTRDIRIEGSQRGTSSDATAIIDRSDSSQWYSTNWLYRKQITINEAKVSGSADLSSFPVLVSTTDGHLRGTTSAGFVYQTDGGDILFTSADGITKIDHEVERYVDSTGQLVAWVEVPTLDYNDNTVLYMYFGNSAGGETNQWNINGTWDSNYAGVWHLNDDPSIATDGDCGGGSKEVCESTSNTNEGDSSMDGADYIDAKIGKGYDFDGSGDLDDVYMQNHSSLNITSNITISTWMNPTAWSGAGVISKTDADHIWDYQLYINSSGQVGVYTDASSWDVNSSATVSTGAWHQIVFTKSGASWAFYIDGASTNSGTGAPSFQNDNQPLDIGYDGAFYDGGLDEVRILNTARSSDWIATQYNNESSPSSFMTIADAFDPSSVKATVTLSATGRANYVYTFYLSNWEAYRMLQNNWGGSSGDDSWAEGQDDYSSKSSTTPTSTEVILLQSDTE